ncbi:hypothetical protein PCE1_001010 [Barthelona sp. PCE]
MIPVDGYTPNEMALNIFFFNRNSPYNVKRDENVFLRFCFDQFGQIRSHSSAHNRITVVFLNQMALESCLNYFARNPVINFFSITNIQVQAHKIDRQPTVTAKSMDLRKQYTSSHISKTVMEEADAQHNQWKHVQPNAPVRLSSKNSVMTIATLSRDYEGFFSDATPNFTQKSATYR